MLITRLTQLGVSKPSLLAPAFLSKHLKIYPHVRLCKGVCPSSGGTTAAGEKSKIVRAERSGPCRLAFIPDEWFLFFHPITGVSGPYIFILGVTNYLVSKEIFVMEHEYYLGLSVFVVLYLATTRLGPAIGASLDKDVDAISKEFAKCRKDELDMYENIIKESQDSQWRAEGQKGLMNAKKENIAMQLEAEYRERGMRVYRTVRDRMDYHVKRYNAEARIQQKWMTEWILENVNNSITPEFQQQALTTAISDLAAAAGRGKGNTP